jgi:hypothetical protein
MSIQVFTPSALRFTAFFMAKASLAKAAWDDMAKDLYIYGNIGMPI